MPWCSRESLTRDAPLEVNLTLEETLARQCGLYSAAMSGQRWLVVFALFRRGRFMRSSEQPNTQFPSKSRPRAVPCAASVGTADWCGRTSRVIRRAQETVWGTPAGVDATQQGSTPRGWSSCSSGFDWIGVLSLLPPSPSHAFSHRWLRCSSLSKRYRGAFCCLSVTQHR